MTIDFCPPKAYKYIKINFYWLSVNAMSGTDPNPLPFRELPVWCKAVSEDLPGVTREQSAEQAVASVNQTGGPPIAGRTSGRSPGRQ